MPRNASPSTQRAARAPGASPAPHEPGDPSVRVLRQFRRVFNAVKTHFHLVEKSAGVGGAQVWALGVIGEGPGISVGELAAAMDIHQSTASNLVRSLLARDLVSAARGGTDRRAVQLTILPAGRAILQRTPGPFAGVLPTALGRLDARTLARLEKDLAALLGALHTDDQAEREPLSKLLRRPARGAERKAA